MKKTAKEEFEKEFKESFDLFRFSSQERERMLQEKNERAEQVAKHIIPAMQRAQEEMHLSRAEMVAELYSLISALAGVEFEDFKQEFFDLHCDTMRLVIKATVGIHEEIPIMDHIIDTLRQDSIENNEGES